MSICLIINFLQLLHDEEQSEVLVIIVFNHSTWKIELYKLNTTMTHP